MKFIFVLIIVTCNLFGFGVNISSKTIANGRTALLEFDKKESVVFDKLVIGKKSYIEKVC